MLDSTFVKILAGYIAIVSLSIFINTNIGTGSVISHRMGDDILDLMNINHNSSPLLSWTKITAKIPRKRTILQLRKGIIYSKRLLGILGPSGSGKSTFLNILGSRAENLHIESDLKAHHQLEEDSNRANSLSSDNDLSISNDNSQKKMNVLQGNDVAFVYQHDAFFSMLTVMETVIFSAYLSQLNSNEGDRSRGWSVTQSIVKDVMDSLTLSHISESFTGNPEDPSIRGISGGERKRLSVACEIIGKPKLLLADEPTSGLDSFQAQHVIDRLGRLAVDKNIAVVLTVHQPRCSIWEKLDDIMLVGPDGCQIYHGSREMIRPYFESLGYVFPNNTNPAEYLIDLISINTTDSSSITVSKQRIASLVQSFKNYGREDQSKFVSKYGHNSDMIPRKRHSENSLPSKLDFKKNIMLSFTKIGRSVSRFFILLQRSLRQSSRNVAANFVQLSVSGILATALYLVYGRQPDQLTEASVSNRVIVLCNAVINICLLSIITSLQLFKKERTVVSRERMKGLYAAHEYLFGKFLAELPSNVIVSSFYGLVLHYLTNLRCNRFQFMGILSLLSVVTSTMGLAIGSIFQKGDAALSIGPGLMVIFLITGAIGPTGAGKSLPKFLEPLRSLSPIKWGCEAVAAAEFRDQNFVAPVVTVASQAIGKNPFQLVGQYIGFTIGTIGSGFTILRRICQAYRNPDLIKTKPGGNRALDALGIGDATLSRALSSMMRMLLGNLIITWLGLMFRRGP